MSLSPVTKPLTGSKNHVAIIHMLYIDNINEWIDFFSSKSYQLSTMLMKKKQKLCSKINTTDWVKNIKERESE